MRIATLCLFALAACQLGATTSKSEPMVAIDTPLPSAKICAGHAFTTSLQGRSPAVSFDGGRVVPPTVTLTSGTSTVNGIAIWNAASASVEISVEGGLLTTGTWAVRLTRQSDGTTVDLGSLHVAPAPEITEVVGAAVCAGPDVEQTVTVRGTSLQGGVVSLEGYTGVVTANVNTAGTEAVITLPKGLVASGPFPIVVTRLADCTARSDVGITISPRAVVSATAIGPKLQTMAFDTGVLSELAAIDLATTTTLKLRGSGLSSGVRVFIGASEGSAIVATGDTLTATFAAESIAAGEQPVSVQVGACTTAASAITAATSDLHVSRFGSNALPAQTANAFLEIFGDFTQAGQGIATYVDVDTDPIATNLLPLTYDVRLDGSRKAYRVRSSVLPAGGPYDVHTVSFTAGGVPLSGIAQGALRVENQAAPRIVWHNRDWVSSGGTVTVYGCGLIGATFALVRKSDGQVFPVTPAPAARDDSWAKSRFECRPEEGGSPVSQVSFLLDQKPGLYRFRVSAGAISHDDLYPIAITSGSEVAQPFAAVETQVLNPRRLASALVAPDVWGRKYFYVSGGAYDTNRTPYVALTAGQENQIDFSAIDPEHGLVGFEALVGKRPSEEPSIAPLLLADGSRVFLVGGSPMDPDDGVWLSHPANESDGSPRLQGTPSFQPRIGGLPAGVHHYRIAASWTVPQPSVGPLETPPRGVVTVRTSEPGDISFAVTAPCTPERPIITLFRSADQGPLPDETFSFASVAKLPPLTPLCIGSPAQGETFIIKDVGDAPTLNDIPVPLGYLQAFARTATNLGEELSMMSGSIDSGGPLRLFGGNSSTSGSTTPKDTLITVTFEPTAVIGTTIRTTPTGAVAVWGASIGVAPTLDGQIDMPWGVRTPSEAIGRIVGATHRSVVPSGRTETQPNDFFFGFAFTRVGSRAFVFGGLEHSPANLHGNSLIFKQGYVWDEGSLAPTLMPSAALLRERTQMASAFLPPWLYVAAGLGCTSSNCSSRVLLKSVERSKIE